ncbi:hypothetical protein CEXT_214841 [Caerostris extrusa]|uniref:Secreted protein n=1 Tax=Caerostris extrusa TaxID=172846 RepID=A0AAV4M680_CAEEX|nr:hypothetical protein CEXT_214841 [Caerostris extrusa]
MLCSRVLIMCRLLEYAQPMAPRRMMINAEPTISSDTSQTMSSSLSVVCRPKTIKVTPTVPRSIPPIKQIVEDAYQAHCTR